MKEKAERKRNAREAKEKAKTEAENVERERVWDEAREKDKAETTRVNENAR